MILLSISLLFIVCMKVQLLISLCFFSYTITIAFNHALRFVHPCTAIATVTVPPGRYIKVVGQSITLRFNISNDLPPVTLDGIQWTFESSNGSTTELTLTRTPDAHYTFSEDMLSLHVGPLTKLDRGTYTMTATNTAGIGSGSIFLEIES